MSVILAFAALLIIPLLLALAFAYWDDNWSPRHRRHLAEMARLEAETAELLAQRPHSLRPREEP